MNWAKEQITHKRTLFPAFYSLNKFLLISINRSLWKSVKLSLQLSDVFNNYVLCKSLLLRKCTKLYGWQTNWPFRERIEIPANISLTLSTCVIYICLSAMKWKGLTACQCNFEPHSPFFPHFQEPRTRLWLWPTKLLQSLLAGLWKFVKVA